MSYFSRALCCVCLKDFTGRAATRVGYYDAGTGAKISLLGSEEGSDVFVPISVDRKAANTYSGGCTDLCYPRTMTLTIAYYQLDTSTKRIIDAKLKFDDFDKDPSEVEYTLKVVYYPLDYWELIIKFAFENTVFIALFVVIGCISVLVAALYWLNVRITTQVRVQPVLLIVSYITVVFCFVLAVLLIGQWST